MIFALFGILITSLGVTPAFGENDSITVNIDKSSYLQDETILILIVDMTVIVIMRLRKC